MTTRVVFPKKCLLYIRRFYSLACLPNFYETNPPTSALFLLIPLSFTICAASTDQPNILFFLVDDMGTQDTSVSFLNDQDGQPVVSELNRIYRTPNMEKFAENARLFTQAHAYSVCSPTRISLVTGLNAPRHKVTQWTHPKTWKTEPGAIKTKTLRSPEWEVRGLPENIPTLPALLKQSGYATLFAGKAHFGPDDTPNGDPRNIGFDVNIAGFGGGGPGSYWENTITPPIIAPTPTSGMFPVLRNTTEPTPS